MSIPLVQNNEKDSINTSIIAIKRQRDRMNALLGLNNSEEIGTSVFATKTELEDAVTQVETDLAPVDEVTADNMHSVTSNAVYDVTGKVTTWSGNGINLYRIGRFVFGKFHITESGTSPIELSVPWKPITESRCAFINNDDDTYGGQMVIYIDGTVRFWKSGGGTFPSGSVSICSVMYITDS